MKQKLEYDNLTNRLQTAYFISILTKFIQLLLKLLVLLSLIYIIIQLIILLKVKPQIDTDREAPLSYGCSRQTAEKNINKLPQLQIQSDTSCIYPSHPHPIYPNTPP